MLFTRCFLAAALALAATAHAGPYAPAAGQPGSTAIIQTSSSFVGWATGYLDFLPGPNVDAVFQTPAKGLGPATGDPTDVVVLGDSGRITLTFNGFITNGPGADFAVFENSFSDTFLELAWVEVSSNGTNFFRFPNFSLTPGAIGAFGSLDPTNLDGLAGKYRGGYGTPFDLDLLKTVPGLDVNAVRYVRIVDIIADGTAKDSLGRSIYDPYPTVGSGGFDLDAVGVINAAPVPEPSTVALMFGGLGLLGLLARRRRVLATASFVVLGIGALPAAAAISTFDDLTLATESYYFPAADATIRSGIADFNHDYDGMYDSWSGWTYSNTTDTTTAGYTNQYSAYAGSGNGGSANYGIAYLGSPTVLFDGPSIVSGGYFTNSTYAALSMMNGDDFAKKFGGTSGNDDDFLKLTITGWNAANQSTGAVDFYLADYRFADNSSDYIVRDWTLVNLASLGAVSKLTFDLASSDNGEFGIKTPAYFALDDLTVTAVPEPSQLALIAAGLVMLAIARRRCASMRRR